jgi:hypothetical protein
MKTTFMTLIAALFLSFMTTSCDRNGNTGNGANDPTSQFESDKAMKAGDKYGQGTDTAAKETTTLTAVDTTMVEGRHK